MVSSFPCRSLPKRGHSGAFLLVIREEWNGKVQEVAAKVLGESTGNRKDGKETWWWNDEVQVAVKKKKECKKEHDKQRTEETKMRLKEANKATKRAVAIAKGENIESSMTAWNKGLKESTKLLE